MKITSSILLLSIMMGSLSNSWILLWLMLEFNTPMFSMMMSFLKENPHNPLNYFIMQSIPSMFMLITLMAMIYKSPFPTNNLPTNSAILTISFFKMGMAPFHNWMMNIIKTMKKKSITILLTIQKLLPLKIISISKMNNYFTLMITINLLMSNMLILQSTKLNPILMSSSMFNMSWISFNLNLSSKSSLIYFTIYSLMTSFLIFWASKLNIKSTITKTKSMNLNFILSILMISGIPPFWGFLNKLILINLMISSKTPKLFIITLLASSIAMLTGYLKLIISMLMKNNKNKSNLKPQLTWTMLANFTTPSFIMMM